MEKQFLDAVYNGNPTSLESFHVNYRKAFEGVAMAIIKLKDKSGKVNFTASSDGLRRAGLIIQSK